MGRVHVRDLLAEARKGSWRPVYLIVGTERWLTDQAVRALRAAVLGDAPAGLNDDRFEVGPGGVPLATVLSTARTLPMMASSRFVLARLQRGEKTSAEEQRELAAYFEEPVRSCCLVVCADRLDGRSKLARKAKTADAWVDATPLKRPQIRRLLTEEARRRGHRLEGEAASSLLEEVGEDLGALDEALERLSLYVGAGQPIGSDALDAVLNRSRGETVWGLMDGVSQGDVRRALRVAARAFVHEREPPLRLVALLARQFRMVARFREARLRGAEPGEAARKAGAPAFKAMELDRVARRLDARRLAAVFDVLGELDRQLKSSRAPGERLAEEAFVRLARLCAVPQGARGERAASR